MSKKVNECEACLREDIKVDAIVYCYNCSEKLCEDCKKHHRKSKASSSHKLIDISDKLDINSDLAIVEYLANLTKCPRHGTEEVKYLCRDHDQLCCNECAIITHRKCEDLLSLADEINEKIGDNAESNVKIRLDAVDSYVDKLIKHETKYLTNTDREENQLKGCLKELKAKLDAAYNKLEKRIILKMSERKQALSKASSLQIESAEKLKKDVKETTHKIMKTRTMGTSLHIFLLEREICKQVKRYEMTSIDLRRQSSKTLISLSEATSLHEAITKIEKFYKVEQVNVEPSLPSFLQTKHFSHRKLILEHEVSLNENYCRYCAWTGHYIVISFEHMSKLKAYKADDGSLSSTYQCPSPTSVTATENCEFAVALPTSNKINIMKIRLNQIVCIRELKCSRPDVITYDSRNKRLLILARSKMVLRKISLYGTESGCINLRRMDKFYLQYTYNLFVDAQYSHIFISSHGKHMVLCIDMSGNQIFQHGIDYPTSVIADSQGNVYVASYSIHCIQRLCPNGQLLNADIFGDDKNTYPMGMSFNKEMNKMVLTCNEGSGKMTIYNFP